MYVKGIAYTGVDTDEAPFIYNTAERKELYRYKDVPQLGRNYQIVSKENKKLKEQIEKIEEEIEKLKNKI